MPSPNPGPRRAGRWIAVAALAAAVVVAGEALAGVSVVSHTLLGSGSYEAGSDLAFWGETTVATSVIPSPVPAAASLVSGSATRLPDAGSNFSIDAATAGDPAVEVTFVEYPNASHDAYFEVTFTIGTPAGRTATVTVYLQVQSLPGLPTVPENYSFFFDAGPSSSPTGFFVATVVQASEVCATRTTCP
jgi:hypothetical protein